MIVLNVSIIIAVLPSIQQDLGFSWTTLSWVQNAYTLAFGGLLLLGARAGDLLGRRRIFIMGLSLFVLGSFTIGLAQSANWVLVSRALQGMGAAILAPSTLALLTTSFTEGTERTKAVSYYGAVAGIGASIGMLMGGILTDVWSWRISFIINLPLGLMLIWLACRYLPETERHCGEFDLLGSITSTLGMSLLVFSIIRSADSGWTEWISFYSALTSVALLIFFVLHERQARQPLVPLHLFTNIERSCAYLTRFLFIGAMMGFWFFMTKYLQVVQGYTALQAGLAFLPTTLLNFAAALTVPKLTSRFGNSVVLTFGVAITALGMSFLAFISSDSDYWIAVALPMMLVGVGQGLSLSPLTVAALSKIESSDAGAASGLVSVSHQLGASLGLSMLVAVSAAADSTLLALDEQMTHRITSALTAAAMLLLVALFIVVTFLLKPAKQLDKTLGKNKFHF